MAEILEVEARLRDFISGNLTVLEQNIKGFSQRIKPSLEDTKSGWDNIEKSIGFAKGAIGAIVASKAVQWTMQWTKASLDLGSTLTDTANRIGISTDAVQKWDFVAKQSGTSIGALQGGFRNLNKLIYAGDESFKTLGIALKDVNGTVKSTETVFEESVLALSKIENASERSAKAQQLFGRAGLALNGILAEGTQAIQEMLGKTKEYSLILSEQNIKALDKAGDSLQMMNQAMSVAKANIIVGLAPALIAMAEAAAQAAAALSKLLGPLDRKEVATENIQRINVGLKQEYESLKANIAMAEKKGLTSIGWMDQEGNMQSRNLRVAKAELDAMAGQISGNKTIIAQLNEKKKVPGGGDAGGKKEEIQTWKDFQAEQQSFLIKDKADREKHEGDIYSNKVNLAMEASKQIDIALKSETQANKEHYDFILTQEEKEIQRKEAVKAASISTAKSMVGSLQTIGQAAKANSVLMKRLAQGQALIDTYAAANAVYSSAGKIPYVGWILGPVAAIAAVAAGLANVAMIEKQSFAKGGQAQPGFAMVGEQGPELVKFNQPGYVYNARETSNMMGNSNLTFNFAPGTNAQTKDDIETMLLDAERKGRLETFKKVLQR